MSTLNVPDNLLSRPAERIEVLSARARSLGQPSRDLRALCFRCAIDCCRVVDEASSLWWILAGPKAALPSDPVKFNSKVACTARRVNRARKLE